jgi:tRNA uridine 5-carboxymethylaminomethyl modification enzyme
MAETIRSSRTTTASSPPLSASTLLSNQEYDVIVVGGGHAGCDAAAAAARTGAKTALVTQRLDTIGELSCNPSIGGIGKGHLVREIDALGGVMGWTADQAGIHYRLLNRRKGPAVRGPRAQMDRDLYKAAMQDTLRNYPNLSLIEASVQDLLLDESTKGPIESLAPIISDSDGSSRRGGVPLTDEQQRMVRGVVVATADGVSHEIMARAVVITTGTFLRGVLMMGHDRYAGGRHLRDSEQVEPPSTGLAETLQRFDFPLSRLKTGTPARIDGRTIDWAACAIQPTDNPVQAFSQLLQFREEQPPCIAANQVIDCYQTATNDETHKLVLQYEDTLPQYDGLDGKGNGPRYCPSIYKKVIRFPERRGHNCFLEPEGLNTDLVYPNGMSGPYPPEIQQKILRTMKGLGAVEIVRPGYDVEYDFVNPVSLTHTLETKKIGGLYLAGQICGTTGYEEAAAQGIVAGANAGRAAFAASTGASATPPRPFVIGRDEGYIGVLIDDLVTKGTSEPYRMFTSRAEYRISLRADNADLRLTRKGMEYGLVHDEERIAALDAREFLIQEHIEKLQSFSMKVTDWAAKGDESIMGGARYQEREGSKKTAEEVLIMPHVTLEAVEDIMMRVQEENAQMRVQSEQEEDKYDEDAPTNHNQDKERFFTRVPASVHDTVEAEVKYSSYVRRQYKDMESWRKAQGLRIPPDTVYDRTNLPTLSNEELEKLEMHRPVTFADASQISGITQQSLVYLYHNIAKRNKMRDTRSSATTASTAATMGGASVGRDNQLLM